MASAANSARQSYFIEYGTVPPEEMDSLRRVSDPNVSLKGRPATDEFDESHRSVHISIRPARRKIPIGSIRLTPELPGSRGPAFAWIGGTTANSAFKGFVRNRGVVHISRAHVHPDFQQQGLGTALFLAAYELSLRLGYRHAMILVEPNEPIAKTIEFLFHPFAKEVLSVAHDTPGPGVPVRVLRHELSRSNVNLGKLWKKIRQKHQLHSLDVYDDVSSRSSTVFQGGHAISEYTPVGA